MKNIGDWWCFEGDDALKVTGNNDVYFLTCSMMYIAE